MRLLTVILISLGFLATAGCAAHSKVDALGHQVWSGNPVRDWVEADIRQFRKSHALKDDVLKRIGGQITRVPDPLFFAALPHSELSTLRIPPETIAGWSKQYALSAETYYVQCEDGNDFILFFDSSGRLLEYVHL